MFQEGNQEPDAKKKPDFINTVMVNVLPVKVNSFHFYAIVIKVDLIMKQSNKRIAMVNVVYKSLSLV